MDQSFSFTQLIALDNMSPVGHHLVYIHICLCTTARLPHMKRKLTIMPAIADLIRNIDNELPYIF